MISDEQIIQDTLREQKAYDAWYAKAPKCNRCGCLVPLCICQEVEGLTDADYERMEAERTILESMTDQIHCLAGECTDADDY